MSLAWLDVRDWKALLARRGLRRRAGLRLVRPQALARRRGLDLHLPQTLVERERARRRRRSTTRRRRSGSSRRRRARPRPAALRARRRAGTSTRPERSTEDSGSPPCATSAIRRPPSSAQRSERHAPDRADARAQRLRRGRIGAALREGDRRAEGLGGADQRADVAGVGDVPERKRRVTLLPRREVGAPVDADDARRMRRARHVGEQLRLDVLAGPQAGRREAPVAAATASSPSTKKSPSFSRQRLSCSLRTSFRRSLSLLTITCPTPATRRESRGRRDGSGARRGSAGAPGRSPCRRAPRPVEMKTSGSSRPAALIAACSRSSPAASTYCVEADWKITSCSPWRRSRSSSGSAST